MSGAQLRAAYEIAHYGYITRATARALHKDGLQVKGRYPIKDGDVGGAIERGAKTPRKRGGKRTIRF